MRIDSTSLLAVAEKYVALSKKSRDLVQRLNNLNGEEYEELMEKYISAVLEESAQSKHVKKAAGYFFGTKEDEWQRFIGCVWSWADGRLPEKDARATVKELLK